MKPTDALCKLDGGEYRPLAMEPGILDGRGVGKPQEEGGDVDSNKYFP